MRHLLVIFVLSTVLSLSAAGELQTIDIEINNRAVTKPGNVVRVTEGESVLLRWHSDEAVELHLHGIDVTVKAKAHEPAEMQFEAAVSGRFPVTSHGFGGSHQHGHETLLYVEVYPK